MISQDPQDTPIADAEVERLLALARGLLTGTVKMTEGDLLRERIRVKRALLSPNQTAAVYAQIRDSCQSQGTGACRFAVAVLFPLIGTQVLTREQLKQLLKLVDWAPAGAVDAAYSLCHRNAGEMQQIVQEAWPKPPHVLGVYRATRNPLLLESLVQELEASLEQDRYRVTDALPLEKQIVSTILEIPPTQPSVSDLLLRLLRSSKAGGPLRDQIEETITASGDVRLFLPLLAAFDDDLADERALYRGSTTGQEYVRKMQDQHERLRERFRTPEGTAVRRLYETLRSCQALPRNSDQGRLELRRRAVVHAGVILDRAATVLLDFIEMFAGEREGQTDLVYTICSLPRLSALPFLQAALVRNDLSATQHAVLALALSYVFSDDNPERPKGVPVAVPPDDNKSRTWLGDQHVEIKCHEACAAAATHLDRIFESSPKTHEERLTGFFLSKLQVELQHWSESVQDWAAKTFGRNSRIRCTYEDVAASGPEKAWGADVGFYLSVRADGVLRAERAFLAQVKKARVSASGHELAWRIDTIQRDVLIGQSAWSVFLLYGCYRTGTSVRVAPAYALRDVMAASDTTSRIRASKAVGIARPFSEFFVYDFLAAWWGDVDGRALDICRGRTDDFGVRALFSVEIDLGTVG